MERIDVFNYLNTELKYDVAEATEMANDFWELHRLSSDEFQKLSFKAKDFYSYLLGKYDAYAQVQKEQKLVDILLTFDIDIRKYTSNNDMINHFKVGGMKLVWLSYTDDEKKQIASAFGESRSSLSNVKVDPQAEMKEKIKNKYGAKASNNIDSSNFEDESQQSKADEITPEFLDSLFVK